jgi:hypothetical protein
LGSTLSFNRLAVSVISAQDRVLLQLAHTSLFNQNQLYNYEINS